MLQFNIKRVSWYLCFAVIMFSLVIRFYYMDKFTYDVDEAISVTAAHGVAQYGLPYLPGKSIYQRSHLSLYLVGLCIKLFGFNPISIRAVSVLAGIILIILVYLIGSKYFDRGTGLIAALILAVSPMQFRYALSARMYGLWELLSFILIVVFFKGFVEDNKKYKLLTLLFFSLSMFTHRLTVCLLPAMLLFLVYEKKTEVFKDSYLYVYLGVVIVISYLTIYFLPGHSGGSLGSPLLVIKKTRL